MDTISLKQRFKNMVSDLWPTGLAWEQARDDDSFIGKITCLISTEVQRLDGRVKQLIKETNPNSTFEMITDWEDFLGIPDECTCQGEDCPELTLFDRRVRILQKLTTGGGQSKAFYQLIAQQLGYDTDILDVEDYKDFRVGQARVGDALTNGISNPATGWSYTFAIVAPAALIKYFRVGLSSVGEPLLVVNNEVLECVINKFKPAHVTVLFLFGD